MTTLTPCDLFGPTSFVITFNGNIENTIAISPVTVDGQQCIEFRQSTIIWNGQRQDRTQQQVATLAL